MGRKTKKDQAVQGAVPVSIMYSSDPIQASYALNAFERLMEEGQARVNIRVGFSGDGGVVKANVEYVDDRYLVGGYLATVFSHKKRSVAM